MQANYLTSLREIGIPALYISDGTFSDVELPRTISDQTRTAVHIAAKRAIEGVCKAPVVVKAVKESVEVLLTEILRERDVIIALTDIKSVVDHTFAHSVNVAVLSLTAGKVMGLHRLQLFELGVGALLHDIGKANIPPGILDKVDSLTPEEMETVKKHPGDGFEILRKTESVPLLSAHVAFQHHERWDGSGYPRRLQGEAISLYGRLCGVCDVFDALSSDRPYKHAIHHSETLAFIHGMSATLFDPEMVRLLESIVAPYPVATLVELTTGDFAVVKAVKASTMERPLVVVIKDPRGQFYEAFQEIDLSSRPEIAIKRYVSWYDNLSIIDGGAIESAEKPPA